MFTSTLPIFQTYLLPNLPFRRRHSSTTSTASTTSTSTTGSGASGQHTEARPAHSINGHSSVISCSRCHADLALTSQIISKGFTGRHGRAYLVSASDPSSLTCVPPSSLLSPLPANIASVQLPNTHAHKPVPRHLVTGLHTVCDVSCAICGSILGWKYVGAEEDSQRYKVGKFILESRRTVVGNDWEGRGGSWAEEDEMAGIVSNSEIHMQDEEVIFDSQDEEECEDLFAGVWTPEGAQKRRRSRLVSGR